MESAYIIKKEGDVLRLSFGRPAQNDEICRDAFRTLQQMKEKGELTGGKIIRLNGPASLPVIALIVHELCHLYAAVAIYDPKLGRYVIAVTHDPDFRIGDLID